MYIGQTGRSFTTRYTEHIQAIHKTHKRSNFADHIVNNNHTYTDINTDMEILHIQHKSRKLNTLEQYEIYKQYNTEPNNMLNEHIPYKSHTLFETITNNIS